jgi:ketosteroid isomerase-like protein
MYRKVTAIIFILFIPLLVISQTKRGEAKIEDEVRKADAEFHKAFMMEDAAALENLLTNNFLWTHSTGEIWTKQVILERIRSGKSQYDIAETDDVKVYPYKDTAVVSGHATRRYPGKDTFWLRYTAVFVKIGGKWKAAAFHSSHVPGPTGAQ